MQNDLKIFNNLTENITINNASKDYTEFLLNDIFLASKKPIIFINQGIKEERVIKNFNFLNPNLRVKFIEEAEEVYSFKAQDLLSASQQNKAINQVAKGEFDILFLDYKMLLKKLPSVEFFKQTLILNVGEKFGYSSLVNQLFNYGFLRCDTVFDFGEFAVRGFIVDVGTLDGFFRIEFDGETISSITKFNTESQRKNINETTKNLEIFKIKQVVLAQNWQEEVKNNAFSLGVFDVNKIISDISNFASLGLCGFLPLFHNKTQNILDFFPSNSIFVRWSNLEQTLEFFENNLQDLHTLYKKDLKSFLDVNALLYNKNEILQRMKPLIELRQNRQAE